MNRFKKYLIKYKDQSKVVNKFDTEDLNLIANSYLKEPVTSVNVIKDKSDKRVTYVYKSETNIVTIEVITLELNLAKWLRKGVKILQKPFKYE